MFANIVRKKISFSPFSYSNSVTVENDSDFNATADLGLLFLYIKWSPLEMPCSETHGFSLWREKRGLVWGIFFIQSDHFSWPLNITVSILVLFQSLLRFRVLTDWWLFLLLTINVRFRPNSYKTAQRSFTLTNASILNMINLSLQTDWILQAFKVEVIKPLLKKSLLDPAVLANYRLISNRLSRFFWNEKLLKSSCQPVKWSFIKRWFIWRASFGI